MTRLTKPLDEVVERFKRGIAELHVGSVRVRQVDAHIGVDSMGDDALFVEVVLSDPEGDTWPVDDVLELHGRINQVAQRLALPLRWIVSLRPESPDEIDPDEAEPDSGSLAAGR